MSYYRTQRLPKIILTQSLVGLIMFSLGLTIVFFAQGYRLNLKNFHVIKTGIIYLSADQKDANVYVNGKLESNRLPFSKNLSAGYYDIKIEKSGYSDWQLTAKVEAELVANYKEIIMFKLEPKITDLKDSKKIDLLHSPIDSLAITRGDSLANNDYEIWVRDRLVARFSEPITRAIWYEGRTHIVFQQGSEIRIIEVDGTNDTVLVKLSNAAPTNFMVGNHGSEIYFIDAGKYKIAAIR